MSSMDQFALRISGPMDQGKFIEVLSELLSTEFKETPGGGWQGWICGGTRFELRHTDSSDFENEYNLLVVTDRLHPLFRNQEKTLGRFDDLPAFLHQELESVGMVCALEGIEDRNR